MDAHLKRAKEHNPEISQSARQLLEYGYWKGNCFMAHVENAANIADFKYRKDKYTIVWSFDQSSCHRKFYEQALIVKSILVKDGGGRRVRDMVWANQPQRMVTHKWVARCCT